MKRTVIAAGFFLLHLMGCSANAPPFYESDAREFLRAQGVDASLIEKVTHGGVLTAAEVARVQGFDNVAVKHLLGSNLGTPQEQLIALAKHPDVEVRTGVAINPKTPMNVLLSLRVPGRYATINHELSRNPMLPQSLLREMYDTGEAGVLGLAMNPNLPEDLMHAIDKKGGSTARAVLARNPKLPRGLLDKYLQDAGFRSEAQTNAQIDPRFKKPQDDMLGGP